ncbi:MAG TPA: hypothetical protein VMR65_10870 [Candidatus Sulfotelmatobacter sp.]|jgi:hypothetical protein|nr:hypothetical protein [Candidatus Sulfotelmatobacter sp.]
MKNKGSWVGLKMGAAAVAVLAAYGSAAAVQVRFEVPEPFRVVGRAFDAGVVSVHSVGAYTPGTALLEVWVGGTCIGMVTARTVDAEVPSGHDEAVFHRGSDGRLEMLGFRESGHPSGRTFRFVTPAAASPAGGGSSLTASLGTD